MKGREGDLVETGEGLIFDVKGLVHPSDRVIAFIRYIPDEKGERRRGGVTYRKIYSLSERYAFLKEKLPWYFTHDSIFDEMLCEVPINDVKKHYKPVDKLQELRRSKELNMLESRASQLAQLLKEEANIPWKSIGISGSIMVGLDAANSDIDPVVYGSQSCRRVHSTLNSMFKFGHEKIRSYTLEDLKVLFDFRSKDTSMNFEDFVRTESRKVLQGKFMGTDYFVRFVKDWVEVDETYGDVQYKNVGYARIEATVVDDSEAIFTPCTYRIEDAKALEGTEFETISEIASFRGRFCEQARTGEVVIAQGKVEHVIDRKRNHEYFRLLVGTKPSDHIFAK